MKKRNIKFCALLTSALMIFSALSCGAAAAEGAAEAAAETSADNILWETYYENNFNGLNELTDDNTKLVYNSAADAVKLTDDGNNGKYLTLDPAKAESQADSTGAKTQWCLDIRAFDPNAGAANTANPPDPVKLEYKFKFTRLDKQGNEKSDWKDYSSLNTKNYIGTERKWAARIAPEADGLRNVVSSSAFKGELVWYTIVEEVKGGKWTTYLYNDKSELLDSAETSGAEFLKEYLVGCDGAGYGILIDDIKVSYGKCILKDFELNFDNFNNKNELPTAPGTGRWYIDPDVGAEYELVNNPNPTGLNTNTGKCLKLKNSDDKSGKAQMFINAFENAAYANSITVEYDAMIEPGTNLTDNGALKGKTLIGSTYRQEGYSGTGTGVNGMSVGQNWRVRFGWDGLRYDKPVAGEWYHLKQVIPVAENNKNGEHNVRTIVTPPEGGGGPYDDTTDGNPAEGNTNNINARNLITAGKIQSMLIGTGLGGAQIYYDNIKVTYNALKFDVKLYAGEVEQTDTNNADVLTDKAVIDFGTEMKTDTVNTATLRLVKDGTPVEYTGAFESGGSVYNMNLSAPLAVGNYTLTLTTGAETAGGVKADADLTFDFTVVRSDHVLTPETIPADFVLDFDSYTATDRLPTSAGNERWYIDPEQSPGYELIDGPGEGNKVLKLKNGTAAKAQMFINAFDNAEHADSITVEYDAMIEPGADLTDEGTLKGKTLIASTYRREGYTGNANGVNGMSVGQNWRVKFGWDGLRYDKPVAGEWYHLKQVIPVGENNKNGTHNVRTMITPPVGGGGPFDDTTDGKASGETNINARDLITAGKIQSMLIGTGAGDAQICYDNIKITYGYNAPAVTGDSVSIFTSESEESDWRDVNPAANAVEIDFGAPMDVDTLTDENVYVTVKDSDAHLSVIPSYTAGGKYRMTFEQPLAENTTYTIHVGQGVQNVAGAQLSDAQALDFTTGTSKLRVRISGFTIDGASADLSKIKESAGKTAAISVVADNYTETAQPYTLIAAYYAGAELKAAVNITDTGTLLAGSNTLTKQTAVPQDVSDVTSVKIMCWDSPSDMRPLCSSLEISE